MCEATFETQCCVKDLHAEMYSLVRQQLNDTFNPENFDEESVTNKLYELGKKQVSLQKPDFTFRRYLYKGDRLYVKLPLYWSAEGLPSVGTEILDWGYSLTTLIGWSEPSKDSGGLQEWKVKMRLQGIDPEAYAEERANFGTTMHYLFNLFLDGEVFKKEGFTKNIYELMLRDKVLSKAKAVMICEKYSKHLWNALIGFSKFIQDYNVRPIATELIVHDRTFFAGTPIDLVCDIDLPVKIKVEVPTGEFYKVGEKKGQPKMQKKTFTVPITKRAIVDFKSGTSGFWNAHYYQLNWGAKMLQETYNIDAEVLLNYAPNKDMGTGYKTQIQQGNATLDSYLPLMKLVAREQLYNRFKKGIDIYNEERDMCKELSFKSLTPKTQYEGYKIENGRVVLEDVDYSFDIKEIYENRSVIVTEEAKEGEQETA